MTHLSLEVLARLLDEAPTTEESSHLERCELCSTELDALRMDQSELGNLPQLLPPPAGAWAALEERLRDEGLVGLRRPRRGLTHAPLLRLAAALAIFLLGGVAGFGARGAGPGSGAPSLAAETEAMTGYFPAIGTVDEWSATMAARRLEEAEIAYREALIRYAELSADPMEADPMARLTVLESIVSSTRTALSAAPADPLINGYHLTALAQRDATVRQLAMAGDDRWY